MVYTGETASETLAQVIMKDPDWALLPASTPAPLRELLRRCLIKDPRTRLQAIGEARIAIDEASRNPAADSIPVAGVAPEMSRRREWMWAVVSLVLLAAAVGLAIRLVFQPVADAPTVRFDVIPPEGLLPGSMVEISPDGRRLAFVAASQGKNLIWIHSFDSSTAEPLPSTEGIVPALLMWSPDNRYIAFATDGKLKKVEVAGGPAQAICNLPPPVVGTGYNGAWNTAGTILLGGVANSPLLRVSANGGEPEPASAFDAARKESVHRYPSFLPDGRHYFFLASSGREGPGAHVGTLDSAERRPLPGIASWTTGTSRSRPALRAISGRLT